MGSDDESIDGMEHEPNKNTTNINDPKNVLMAGSGIRVRRHYEYIELELSWAWDPASRSIPKGDSSPKETQNCVLM